MAKRKKNTPPTYKSIQSAYSQENPFWSDYNGNDSYSSEEWRVKQFVDRGYGNGVQEEGYMSSLELEEMVI